MKSKNMIGFKSILIAISLIAFLLLGAPVAAQQETCHIKRYDLAKWYWLLYDEDLMYLLILDDDYNPRLLNEYGSYPAVTPEKDKFVFLAPWGFEEMSSIYLVLADDNYTKTYKIEIPAIKDRTTPKEILWLDDARLLVIAGFTDGTVTRGGDLFYYDYMADRSGKIIECHDLEIARMSVDKDAGKIYLYMVSQEYNAAYAIIRDCYTEELELDELHRLIREADMLVFAEKPERRALYPIVYDVAGWWYRFAFSKLTSTTVYF